MQIIAHDEDSMTNLLFSELHRCDLITDFIKKIKWRHHKITPFEVKSLEVHQQINISEFGRPDLILIITDMNDKFHILMIEVKLGTYLDACLTNVSNKFDGRNNSRLNNQLTLKYRAIKSFNSLNNNNFITECKHTLKSPYSHDKVRRCKKNSTINFFKKFVDNDTSSYLVTLTSDKSCPISFNRLAIDDPCYPIFFDEALCKNIDFKNLGSITWKACERLFQPTDSYIKESFKLHFDQHSVELENEEFYNPDEIKPVQFIKGRKIIIFKGKKCLFTGRGYSFAIRKFEGNSFIEIYRGKKDIQKYMSLKDEIQIIEEAPRVNINDVDFWKGFFEKLKIEIV